MCCCFVRLNPARADPARGLGHGPRRDAMRASTTCTEGEVVAFVGKPEAVAAAVRAFLDVESTPPQREPRELSRPVSPRAAWREDGLAAWYSGGGVTRPGAVERYELDSCSSRLPSPARLGHPEPGGSAVRLLRADGPPAQGLPTEGRDLRGLRESRPLGADMLEGGEAGKEGGPREGAAPAGEQAAPAGGVCGRGAAWAGPAGDGAGVQAAPASAALAGVHAAPVAAPAAGAFAGAPALPAGRDSGPSAEASAEASPSHPELELLHGQPSGGPRRAQSAPPAPRGGPTPELSSDEPACCWHAAEPELDQQWQQHQQHPERGHLDGTEGAGEAALTDGARGGAPCGKGSGFEESPAVSADSPQACRVAGLPPSAASTAASESDWRSSECLPGLPVYADLVQEAALRGTAGASGAPAGLDSSGAGTGGALSSSPASKREEGCTALASSAISTAPTLQDEWEEPASCWELPFPPPLPGGAWADHYFEPESEHTGTPGAAAGACDQEPDGAPVLAAEERYDHIGFVLGLEEVLKQGGWDKVRLAAMPVGISMKGPRRKVVKRIVQAWLCLPPGRLRSIAHSMAAMEQREELAAERAS